MKKLLLFGWLMASVVVHGADLNASITFVDGQRLTASQLNSLIPGATIIPGFYNGHTLKTTLFGSDVILVLSSGAYYRISANSFLYNNTAIITNQVEKVTPAGADFVLIYDAAGTAFAKVSLNNLLLSNSVYASQPLITNPLLSATVPIVNDGTNNRIALSNIWLETWYYGLTNLATHTTPIGLDKLLIFDNAGGTNKQITLISLLTNTPSVTPAALDMIPIGVNGGSAGRMTVSGLSNVIVGPKYTKFTTNGVTLAAGQMVNGAHSLSNTPTVHWTMVCQTSDLCGYNPGDELPAEAILDGAGISRFIGGANTTNVFFASVSTLGALNTYNKTNGIFSTFTASRWKAKAVAVLFN